jgi:holo-[acyl-carrier protein] synthase
VALIVGLGVDLCRISRIETVIGRWGDRFLGRVFTPAERALGGTRPRPAHFFAGRFAAKEAASKALGTGIRNGFRWREVETLALPTGEPVMTLTGGTLELMRRRGGRRAMVSMSDEGDYAVATVVLEG